MKKRLKFIPRIIFKIIVYFLIFTFVWVGIYKFINPPITPLMIVRFIQGSKIDKEWKDYESISDNMKLAVIAAEDQRFLMHSGFDFIEVRKALEEKNRGRRDKLRGASTISQQVAKNVFLYPSRSWVRKGFEAYFTFLVELLWGKKRIIELYLNVAETGDGLYGVERAAELYFGKPAKNLSRGQAALIAAALPNPRAMNPSKPSDYLYSRQSWIIRQMNHIGGARILKGL